MKITLLAVGKTTDTHIAALINDYCKRLSHYVPFEMVIVPDIRNAKSLSEDQLKNAEGKQILRFLNLSTYVVLLDEHGELFRSVDYAEWLGKKMGSGRDLTLVIGGAYGFSQEVYDRADALLALSPMTFSHQMIRLIAVEQLYRAMTILRHEPYHHE